MRFCMSHWNALRAAIELRGLSGLVPQGGMAATVKQADQLQRREVTRENFDPLMSAHWAIAGNVMTSLSSAGMNPLYLMSSSPEDAVEGYAGYEGRTWPRCPLCYINLAHEVSCTDDDCRLPKQNGYDWMIDRAADDALDEARQFKLAPEAS